MFKILANVRVGSCTAAGDNQILVERRRVNLDSVVYVAGSALDQVQACIIGVESRLLQ